MLSHSFATEQLQLHNVILLQVKINVLYTYIYTATLLHLFYWIYTYNIEGFFKNESCSFTQEYATHVNSKNFSSYTIFFHTIARVIELSEGGAQLIKVITECMGR